MGAGRARVTSAAGGLPARSCAARRRRRSESRRAGGRGGAQQREAWTKLPRKPKAAASEAELLLRDADRGDLRTLPASGATRNQERENDSTVVFDSAPAATAPSPGSGGLGGFGGGLGGAGG